MKKFYSTIIFVFVLTITYSQSFEFSLSYIGVNPNTNNHQVAFIFTPDTAINNRTKECGGGFYVPSGMTIGNFEAGTSGIPANEWFSTSLGSNGNGDAYIIQRVDFSFIGTLFSGSGPFELVLFDIIANPNPVTGSITIIENGDPIFDTLNNYISLTDGTNIDIIHTCQIDQTANSLDFSTLNTGGFEVLSLKLYPNPSKGMLYLKGNVDKLRTVEIYSITGQQVMTIKDNFKGIDMGNLDPALYFVKLYTIEGSKVFKIIRE